MLLCVLIALNMRDLMNHSLADLALRLARKDVSLTASVVVLASLMRFAERFAELFAEAVERYAVAGGLGPACEGGG